MKRLLRLPAVVAVQLLKYQAMKLVGEEALGAATEALADAVGEDVLAQIDRWLESPAARKRLEDAVASAEQAFASGTADPRMRAAVADGSLAADPRVRAAIEALPEAADEEALRQALVGALRQRLADLPDATLERSAELYLAALRRNLLRLKEGAPAVVGRAVLRIESSLRDMSADLDEVRRLLGTLLDEWRARSTPRVGRAIIDYSWYIADKTAGFTGRGFVFAAIDRFLAERGSGYLLIRGDPGIGKTAIMAELVRRAGHPHHFNIAAEGLTRPVQFLANASAQLIAGYGLDLTLPDDPELSVDSLRKTLDRAAQRAGAKGVVLLVDALDEAATPAAEGRRNPLLLPYSLPPGCRVIATTRRTSEELEIDAESVQPLELVALSPDNLDDVRAYVTAFARLPRVRRLLPPAGLSEDAFVQALVERSEGNFMYLRHVLPALGAGAFGDAGHFDVAELPRGLRGYYERHWARMRGEDFDLFVRVYQKIIAVLATARQPVRTALIARAAGLGAAEVTWTIERWREFLQVTPDPGGDLYRIYHASYRDFLAGKTLAG